MRVLKSAQHGTGGGFFARSPVARTALAHNSRTLLYTEERERILTRFHAGEVD